MSAVELYKLCKERKIKAEPKKPAKFYIGLLEKADAEAAKDLAKRLEDNDEILGYDHVLLKETFNKETNEYESCLDLINELFYDDYGKLRKYYCAIPTVDQWIAATEREHTVSLNMFPREEIERALEFLSDLWLDNEHSGWNRPDGTFNADRGNEAE